MANITKDSIPFGYIYRIINKKSGKTYIGMRYLHRDTKGWRQYLGSSKIIKNIIKKGNKDILIKEFIEYAQSKNDLQELERKYITMEWSVGKGEYNQRIYTPDPSSWNNKNNGEKLIIQQKRNKSHKETINHSNYTSGRSMKAVKDYEKFIHNNNIELLIDDYKNTQSIRKVAKKNNISEKYLRKMLLENNIELNYQNIKNQKITEDKKESIKNGINKYLDSKESFKYTYHCKYCGVNNKTNIHNRKICNACKAKYCKKDRKKKFFTNGEIDEIILSPINKDKSIRELSNEYKIGRRRLSEAFKRNKKL